MSEIHNRLTSRINAQRMKLELRRAIMPAIIVALGAAATLWMWGYLFNKVGRPDGGSSMLQGSTYQVQFGVANTDELIGSRSNVTFEGIPAGRVSSVSLAGGHAVVTASIYKSFGPIYRNATAQIRPVSALQNMYLDITSRGTPSAGPAARGGPLPVSQTKESVEISNVLDSFPPDVRTHITDALDNLGIGLAGNGEQLRAAFIKLVPFIDVAARMTQQLAERRAETRQLVTNTAELMSELSVRNREIRTLVARGGETFNALGDSAANLQATLRELAPTLVDANSALSATRGVLPSVDQALTSLGPVADQLPTALASLRRLSRTANPAVTALQHPVERLVPFSRALAPTASSLQSMTQSLLPQARSVDYITHSIAACPNAMYGFFQWTPSVFSVQDARGVTVRGDLTVGLDSSGGTHDPNIFLAPGCTPPHPSVP